MKRKLLSLLFAIVASIGFSHGAIVDGTCGDDLTWSLNSKDSTLIIEGTGAMTAAPWLEYKTYIRDLSLPEGLTSIKNDAFSGCTNLAEVTIPISVTFIGEKAFYNCSRITSITIPINVSQINTSVFVGCKQLTSVVWNAKHCTIGDDPDHIYGEEGWTENPVFDSWIYDEESDLYLSVITSFTFGDEVEYIPNELCRYLNNVTSISLPNSVTYVGAYAFSECIKLESITLSENLTSIQESTFRSCSFSSISIPNSVTSIGKSAFSGGGLTSITIPNSVTSIGVNAFGESELSAIELPESITTIEKQTFQNCRNLKAVTLGSGITELGKDAFSNCKKLYRLTINATTPPEGGANCGINNTACNLYVPEEAVETYANSIWWEDFASIQAIGNEPAKPDIATPTPDHAEADVMALYCNHYETNNLNFNVLDWGGIQTWETLDLDGTNVLYCQDMKWEMMTNWDADSYDFSAFEKFHFDVWVPEARHLKVTFEAQSGWKHGIDFKLNEGWNTIDADPAWWISEEAPYDWKDVKYIAFEGFKNVDADIIEDCTSAEGTPFAFANLYWWKSPAPENIPQAAPEAPEWAENEVQALFSNTYQNRTYNFDPTRWGTQWVEHQYDNGERIFFTESMTWDCFTNWDADHYDLSAFDVFHADIYVTVDSKIKISFEALAASEGGNGWKNGAFVELKANQWNKVDLDLQNTPPFDTYDFSDVRYLILENFQLPDGSSAEGTPLAIANAYFYNSKETPSSAPTTADLAAYGDLSNDVVLAFKFDEAPCNEVVLVGTYNGWSTSDISALTRFTPMEGFDGWYVATFPWEDGAQGKAVQLEADGSFNWEYQTGDVDAWIHIDGKYAYVQPGYDGESNDYYPEPGAYIYEIAYWKNHNNPCTAVYHVYNITLISPDCNEEDYITPAISGSFNNWAQEAMTMNELKTAERQQAGLPGAVFEYSVKAAEGTEFKFRSAAEWGEDWSNQLREYNAEDDAWQAYNGDNNIVLGEQTDLFFDLGDPELYSWDNCEKPYYCDESTHFVVVGLNAPAGAPEAGIEIIGSFDGWTGTAMELYETGWYVAFLEDVTECDEFKFREAGTWDNEIVNAETGEALANFRFKDVWTDDTWKGEPCKWIELDLSNYAWKAKWNQHNYDPQNLSAEPGAGKVTLRWEVEDQARYYWVGILQNGDVYQSDWFEGDTREATFTFSNTEAMEFSWVIEALDYNYNAVGYAEGEPFTVQPSPYIAKNLQAAPNGDGTFSLTWDAAESEEVTKYWVRVFNPAGMQMNEGWAYAGEPFITCVLAVAGDYQFSLASCNDDVYDLGYAYKDFTVEPVAEHSITARVLIQPTSGMDTSEGVLFYTFDADITSHSFAANDEGNGWFNYTWTTTDPGIVLSLNDDYWSRVAIAEDTCLELTDYLHFADCDARLLNFTPFNLKAEAGAGKVTLSWEVEDQAYNYVISLYRDGYLYAQRYYSGDTRAVTFKFSNPDDIEFTWSVAPYMNEVGVMAEVFGEPFTITPTIYSPRNLQATPNADGTYTITWDPIPLGDVLNYVVQVFDYNSNNVCNVETRETSAVTSALTVAGTYYYYVLTYSYNWDYLGYAYSVFEVEPAAQERNITARVLVQPNSGYDTGDGVWFYTFDEYGNFNEVQAAAEGNGWYTYTWTTTQPGIRFGLNGNYNAAVAISTDACLEYLDDLHFADCDTRLLNFAPFNLKAEPGAGKVTLSWEVEDQADRYYIHLYHGEEYWGNVYCDSFEREKTLRYSNTEPIELTWSIAPYLENIGSSLEEVAGEAFTIAPSPYIPQNMQATPNGDGTYTLAWDPVSDDEVINYNVYVYDHNWNFIYSIGTQDNSVVTPMLSVAGTYYFYLDVYSEDWEILANGYTTFEVEEVEEHSITARVLIQPISGYYSQEGVWFYTFDQNHNYEIVQATTEGNGWYTYTWTTTQPGIRLGLDEDYWNAIDITQDTCLEYTYNLHLTDCDTQMTNYAPFNLQAAAGAGKVTLTWEVENQAEEYYIKLYVDGELNRSYWTDGNSRNITINLNNSEKMEFTWSVAPYMDGTGVMDEVFGVPFAVAPSPYIPQNLLATPNGDGTYTITWDPVANVQDANYNMVLGDPNGYFLFEAETQETSVITPMLTMAGEYPFFVYVYSNDWEYLGSASSTFVVEPVEEHEITARVLIQPTSGYNTSAGVTFYIYDESYNYTTVAANDEGDNWYSYTWTTSAPGIRIGLNSSYYDAVTITRDTCLEYLGDLHLAACDAQPLNFAPFNLQAVPGDGKVTLSWEVENQAEYYRIMLYNGGEIWDYGWYYGDTRQAVFSTYNDETVEFEWSVTPYFSSLGLLEEVYGEPFTVEPFRHNPENLQATPNGDGTYTLTWDIADSDAVGYYIAGVYNWDAGSWVGYTDVYENSYVSDVLKTAGTYYAVVHVYDNDGNQIGYAEQLFEVEVTEPRDITVRLLIHPDSEYDTSNGLILKEYRDEEQSWFWVNAKPEGNCWFSYTVNTNQPAARFQFIDKYGSERNEVAIGADACFEYAGNSFNAVDCDAVAHDYRVLPETMQAVSIPGRVDFSWEAIDIAEGYYLNLYTDAQGYNTYFSEYVYGPNYSYIVPAWAENQTLYWSVQPADPVLTGLVFAPESFELQKSEIIISDLTITTTDSITVDLGWKCNIDTVLFELNIYCRGNLVKHDIVSATNYRYTAPCNGSLEWQIRPLTPSDQAPIGAWQWGDYIRLTQVPDPIWNIVGKADGHHITFTWEMNVPGVEVGIFRQTTAGGYEYLYGGTTSYTAVEFDVEEDGLYLIQLYPIVEVEPESYNYISMSFHATAHAFTTETFALELNATEGGYIWPEDMSGNYPAGFEIEVRAYSYEHYRFVGWSDGIKDAVRTITINSNLSLTAEFERIPTHHLAVTTTEGGMIYVSGMDDWATIFEGDFEEGEIYISATPTEGNVFDMWSDGYTGTYRYLNLTSDTIITAIFVPLYQVTLQSTEGGYIEFSGTHYGYDELTNTYTVARNNEIRLEAHPYNGFRFTGWSDGVTTLQRSILVQSDLNITATFESADGVPQYLVFVTATEGGNISINAFFYEGDQIVLSPEAWEGYKFARWSDGSTDNPRTIVVTSDISLVAQFEPIVYTLTLFAAQGGKVAVNDSETAETVSLELSYNQQAFIYAVPDEHYHFAGWSDGSLDDARYVTATDNITLTANFALDEYLVTFLNEDGSFIEAKLWAYGTTPECSIEPVKPATEEFFYTFVGWTPEIAPVTEEAIYTAVFEEHDTALEDIQLEGSAVRKVVVDDVIYIIRGGKIYTVTGVNVK